MSCLQRLCTTISVEVYVCLARFCSKCMQGRGYLYIGAGRSTRDTGKS
jgi:hypothetical protein